jgi:hypothetical protein
MGDVEVLLEDQLRLSSKRTDVVLGRRERPDGGSSYLVVKSSEFS